MRFLDARQIEREIIGAFGDHHGQSRGFGHGESPWQKMAAAICWLSRPERVDVNFVTEKPYFEATIFLDGRQLCQPDGSPYTTPCTVENLPAAVHHVVFKYEGLPDRDAGQVDFREVRQIVARWNAEP